MRVHPCRLLAVIVAALIPLGLMLAPSAAADQCAPPGIDSASALPTNLSAAAKGPEEDKYTTPDVEPLTRSTSTRSAWAHPARSPSARSRTRRRASASTPQGQFTGFDNELLRAVADKLGLQVNFVGTDFSGLLAQVASRRFDVGSSSITTTDARRQTVGFTNGYDFGYFSLVVPPGSPITGFDKLARGPAHRRGAGHRAGGLRRRHPAPGPGEVPRLQHGLRQPQDPPDRRLGGAVAAGASARCRPGDPAVIVENTFSLDNFVAWAVAKENKPLIDALNSGLDAVIADGTWSQLYSEWVPRALPPGWKPGLQGGAAAAAARLRRDRRQPDPARRQPRVAPKSTLAQLKDAFLDWDLYKQADPRPVQDRACRTR